ncbi:hypothetical protein BASA81_005137 [Batrachochytrium salamandrivorans]|nr:hypothetical protein BASA81_005137 [Batrachochytrium salamandrivorans]
MDRLTKKSARKQSGGICEAAAPKIGGFGKKMLEKQGWKEGQGLGANEQGQVKIIKVKTKNDTVGLGQQNEDKEYIAKSLVEDPFKSSEVESIVVRKKAKATQEEWPSSSEQDSDEDSGEGEEDNNGMDLAKLSEADRALFLLCGKRRLGRRAGRNQKGKWARELKSDKQQTL